MKGGIYVKKFYTKVVQHPKMILFCFGVLFVISLFLKPLISVNYDMNDYLPENCNSTISLNVMEAEFDGAIPNARVMVKNVSIPQALEYKKNLSLIDGVTEVTWLDDTINIQVPLETFDQTLIETYYKDNCALFTLTIAEEKQVSAVAEIRNFIGEENAVAGSAVSNAVATTDTISQITKIAIFAVIFVLFILTLTTTSWLEPLIVMAGLGMAIVINAGTNIIFGEISFVTNAAGNILQLAVSLDYSVFILHRFTECCKTNANPKEAMVEALCKSTTSVLSSGLTTVIGFLALCLMQFQIGPDLGLALAKGIALSLITAFIFSPNLILCTYKFIDKTTHQSFLPSFRWFGKLVSKLKFPAVCVFSVLIIPAYLASVNNNYYYGSSHIFDESTRSGGDTAAIEAVFGKSDTYVLMVPVGNTALEKELSDALQEFPEVTSVISYVDMVGAEIPTEYLDSETLSMLISPNYSRMVLSIDADYEGEETFALIKKIRATAQEFYPDTYYLAGTGVSTYDLMSTVTADMTSVNLIAIGAVLVVLIFTTKSLLLPILLVLSIETAIWINLAIPYFSDSYIFYIAYLIISSIQLGATVDYAILLTERYKENRTQYSKKEALVETIDNVMASILTSGITLVIVGFLLGIISTHGLLSQLGYFIGKGTLCSLIIVIFVLPGLLYIFDGAYINKKEVPMKKQINKALTLTLITAITFTNQLPAIAAESSVPKEEVIYATTDAQGKLSGMYVVNIFEGGEITDYGDYSDVKILNTTDEITLTEDKVTFSSDAEKVYYQGTLKNPSLPWNISVKYFLNDKECTPEEIAGKSGDIEITFHVSANESISSTFYDNYALQASLTLDTEKCKNIVAENATIANVGSSKQLTYTILPGQGIDTSIQLEATNFEMAAISINGVPLNLNISLEDDKLLEQVTELTDGISQIDEGAASLSDGTQNAVEGSLNLTTGAASLQSGYNQLDTGISQLQAGILTIQTGLNTLSSKSSELTNGSEQINTALTTLNSSLESVSADTEALSKLLSASGEIKSALQTLTTGAVSLQSNLGYEQYKTIMKQNGLDMDALSAGNTQVINELNSQIASLSQTLQEIQSIPEYQEQAAALQAQIVQLTQIVTVLQGNQGAITGMQSYLDGFSEPVAQLTTGVSTLQTNYDTFDESLHLLSDTLSQLMKSTNSLSSAIQTLTKNYGIFHKGLSSYTDGVDALNQGYAELVSGISSLSAGSSALKSGSATLYQGSLDLYHGMETLQNGSAELSDGTSKLQEETSDMDTKIETEIDNVLSDLQGTGDSVVSFVSEKNTNVTSVQFVIQTEAIEPATEEEPLVKEEEPLTFSEKLLQLFKRK